MDKRTISLRIMALFSGFILTSILVSPVRADDPFSLTADKSELFFLTYEPQIVTLTTFDLSATNGRREYVYLDDGWRGQIQRMGYSARVLGVENGIIKVEVRPSDPIVNGEFRLPIRFYQGPALNIKITVNIDAREQRLFGVNFEFDCETPYYGENLVCNISPTVTGPGRQMIWGDYKTEISFQAKGSNQWKKDKPFKWSIEEAVEHTSGTVTRPTKVRASVTFEGITYKFETTVKLRPPISITAPGAAIVGSTFLVEVKTVASHTGKCTLQGTKFVIRNGYAKLRMYGANPGGLTLWVVCPGNSDWEYSASSRYVYIRQ